MAVCPRLRIDCFSGALCPVESEDVPKSLAIMMALEQGTFTNSILPDSSRETEKSIKNVAITGIRRYLGCENFGSAAINEVYITMVMNWLQRGSIRRYLVL